ncbi:HNH endonuclease, partial [Gordonia sp. N1V]|uniref:HNH endonuclease n=1 Tax=Gordonia sp. N1V TaxID=3034163 RepID=UPI0023E2BDF2
GPREQLLTSEQPVVKQFLSGDRFGPIGMSEEKDEALVAAEAAMAAAGISGGGTKEDFTEIIPQVQPNPGMPERKAVAPGQRKALLVRDRGCIKCGAHAGRCQGHHLHHWADGGPTDLDNGCLLCSSCHDDVHHHGWGIIMGFDRHPWLIPPASID